MSMNKYGETAQRKICKIIEQSEQSRQTTDLQQITPDKATVVSIYDAKNGGYIEELQGE
jgi:hypothetical protein